jgi:hypothetical protein
VELDEELEALFSAPLDEFVGIRNERAAALRKAGERAMAAAVKEQTKPSLTAWVVNQLVRRRREDVEQLLDVGERLRSAHQAALTGAGKQEFDDARRAERQLIAKLVREAERVLLDSGRAPTPGVLERVNRTLRSAPADDEGRELLARGRLVSDVEATGFEALAGLRLPARGAASRKPRTAPARAPRRSAPADARAADAARRDQLREASRVLTEGQARERDLRKRLRQAERAAEEARKVAEKAAEEVEVLAREAAEAAAEAAEAERAVSALRAEAGRAR